MEKMIYTNEFNNNYRKVQNKEPFCFKWILKIEVIIIFILLLFVFLFNLIPNEIKFSIKYNFEKNFVNNKKEENKNYKYDIITASINENSNISFNEKKLIKEMLESEIEENIEYINIKEISKKLENLRIDYSGFKSSVLSYKYDSTNLVAGYYNPFLNKIIIYDSENNYNKDSINTQNKEIYFHEINHIFTDYTISSLSDIFARKLENANTILPILKKTSKDIQMVNRNVFTETINELFTREYLDEKIGLLSGNSYKEYMPYMYVLAEILENDTLKKYKFNDNMSIIVSELLKIDNNINEVYKLISSINLIDIDGENSKLYKNIYESLSYFYEKKYNKNMSDDFEIIAYLYDTKIQAKENKEKLEKLLNLKENDMITDIIPKGYVAEKYKQENSKVKIEYIKSGKNFTFEIVDKYSIKE